MFGDLLSLSEALSFVLNGSQKLLKNLRHSDILGVFLRIFDLVWGVLMSFQQL